MVNIIKYNPHNKKLFGIHNNSYRCKMVLNTTNVSEPLAGVYYVPNIALTSMYFNTYNTITLIDKYYVYPYFIDEEIEGH